MNQTMAIRSINWNWITLRSIGLTIWQLRWFLDSTRDLDMPCIGLESRTMGLSKVFHSLKWWKRCQCFFIWLGIRMRRLLSKKSESGSRGFLRKYLYLGIFLKIWNRELRLRCLVLKLLAKVLLLVYSYLDRRMMAVGSLVFMFTNTMQKF